MLLPSSDLADLEGVSDVDRKTVERCIAILAARSAQLRKKGLSSWGFSFGVANLLVVVWVFGVAPAHFWIVYIVETLILFPIRWKHMMDAKPLPQILSWLDFCWIANILCNVVLAIYCITDHEGSFFMAFLDYLTGDKTRKLLFCMFWGIATGPLLCAVGALGNALVFHDVDNTVSVFIHLCPSLLMFTLRWHRQAVLSSWPGIFHLNYFDSIEPWRDIYMNAVLAYFVWFVPFTLWMMSCGLRMPSKGYDTVFHSLMRGSNPVAQVLGWSAQEQHHRALHNDFTVFSVLIYMAFHATACCSAIIVSIGCWLNRYFHGFACLAMTLAVIYKGSTRYSYYMLDNYVDLLRREFAVVLESEAPAT